RPGGGSRSAAAGAVYKIDFTSRTRGAYDGIKIGGVVGGLAGSVAAPLIFPGTEDNDPTKYILPSIGFGGIIGFTAGSLIGRREHFYFQKQTNPEELKPD
ncbi:MAG: hypothetical protein WAN36_16110, partial [Calditrichia bacterium]